MNDDTTTPLDGSALSVHEGASILAGIRNAEAQPEAQAAAEVEQTTQDEPETTDDAVTTEGESNEPETEESLTVEINLPDGSKITADEAAKGYLRQGDYTRKTQALSQKEREVASREAEAINGLKGLIQALDSQREKEPDWKQVLRDDPIGGPLQKLEWEEKQQARHIARQIAQQHESVSLRKAKEDAFNQLASGEYNSAWKDQNALAKDLVATREYALSLGFTPETLDGLAFAPAIVALDESRRWRELQAKKPEVQRVVANKPKPIRPGSKTNESAADKSKNAVFNRFSQTKTQADGLAALRALRAG